MREPRELERSATAAVGAIEDDDDEGGSGAAASTRVNLLSEVADGVTVAVAAGRSATTSGGRSPSGDESARSTPPLVVAMEGAKAISELLEGDGGCGAKDGGRG